MFLDEPLIRAVIIMLVAGLFSLLVVDGLTKTFNQKDDDDEH